MKSKISKKCQLLADLWISYRDDDNLSEFVEYNDVGLPLAYIVHNGLATITDEGKKYIEETYLMFCASIGIDENQEFDNLEELLGE
jgi:hypothetical protein